MPTTKRSAASKSKATAKPAASASRRASSASRKSPKASRPEARRSRSTNGSGAVASTAFKRAERRAAKVLKSSDEAAKLVTEATTKADDHRRDLGDAFEDLQALLRLIRAYAKREYRDLPTKTVVAAAAAVIYFISPVDLIPDVLAGVGYIDDTAVIL